MHEFHAVESLIRQLIAKAKSNNGSRVFKVTLALGELSGFKEDSILMYFQEIAANTILEKAEVIFKRIKARLICKDCNASFEYAQANLACPVCKSQNLSLSGGREFYVEDMEVETP